MLNLQAAGDSEMQERYNRAVGAISGRVGDGACHGPGGRPAALPMEGAGRRGEQVRLYGGTRPAPSGSGCMRVRRSLHRFDHHVSGHMPGGGNLT